MICPNPQLKSHATLCKVTDKGQITTSKFEVFPSSKVVYQCCGLSKDASHGVFASYDGIMFRIINLATLKMVGKPFTRSSYGSTTLITDLSMDRHDVQKWWVVAAVSIKESVHLFWVDEKDTLEASILSKSVSYLASYVVEVDQNYKKFKICEKTGSRKVCLLSESTVYCIDDLNNVPKYHTAKLDNKTKNYTLKDVGKPL